MQRSPGESSLDGDPTSQKRTFQPDGAAGDHELELEWPSLSPSPSKRIRVEQPVMGQPEPHLTPWCHTPVLRTQRSTDTSWDNAPLVEEEYTDYIGSSDIFPSNIATFPEDVAYPHSWDDHQGFLWSGDCMDGVYPDAIEEVAPPGGPDNVVNSETPLPWCDPVKDAEPPTPADVQVDTCLGVVSKHTRQRLLR